MGHTLRDPIVLFRFALREGDLALANRLLRVLRRQPPGRVHQELPTHGALRAFAHLVQALGLNGERDYDR